MALVDNQDNTEDIIQSQEHGTNFLVSSSNRTSRFKFRKLKRKSKNSALRLKFFLLSQEAIGTVFPYLTCYELMSLACVCRSLNHLTSHSSLWSRIVLNQPFSHSSPHQFSSLSLKSSPSFPLWYTSLRGDNHSPPYQTNSPCPSLGSCPSCGVLNSPSFHLPSLMNLVLDGVGWVTNHHLPPLLLAAPALKSLDITQNVDINVVMDVFGEGRHSEMQYLGFK